MNISKKKILPSGPIGSSILIVGEAPSESDDYHGIPFSQESGQFLDYFLSLAGLNRAECRIMFACPYYPVKSDLKILNGSPQLRTGHQELQEYLTTHQPKIIIPLGEMALNFFGYQSIWSWRGSILPYNSSFVIPTLSPISAEWDSQVPPLITRDLTRAKSILDNGHTVRDYNFIIDPSMVELELFINKISSAKFITGDIETIRETSHILCIGFAISETEAICIKNQYSLGSGVDPNLKLICDRIFSLSKSTTFHNGLFDTEVLYLNDIHVPPETYDYDTMYVQRVIEPELPIGLDFCTSIYTDMPYYKDDTKDHTTKFKQTLWEYNCKDTVATYQTRVGQQAILDSDPILANTARFQMSLMPACQHLQHAGLPFDQERVSLLRSAITSRLDSNRSILFHLVGKKFNTNSPAQLQAFLYKDLALPTRSNQKGKVTTDEDAIVSLLHYCQKEMDDKKTEEFKRKWYMKLCALKMLLEIKEDQKLLSSYINISLSPDGRARFCIKPAGTDTGRWACGKYVDDTGLNAQTFPRGGVEINV